MKKFFKLLLVTLAIAAFGVAVYYLAPCLKKEEDEDECCCGVCSLLAKLCPCKK